MNQDDKTQTSIVLSKGTMVAHYRIVEKIGAGGMGEVYLAEDTELGRRVALKFIPAQFAKDEEHKARFKREAQAAAKLNHPNIVTIYEVSEFNGRPFIVMEHVEGRSLHDFCHKEPLSVIKIIDLAVQISEGLSKAHNAGIIHRDIKSSNIVVDSDGRPKILDFGLATFKGNQEVTKVGSTLGTVSYMSPEQAQGEKIDHRSDLFSFGIVLYELLAGRTPFKRDSDASTLKAIVHDTAEPVTRYRAEVPEELQRIISKLLQRDLPLRYQHADDITADLKLLAITGSSPSIQAYQKKSKGKLITLGVSAIAVLAIIAYFIYRGNKQSVASSSIPMLVVLPFENLGASEDQYFADGITDEITSRLAGLKNLRVISRTSAIQYRTAKKTIKEIGQELNVDYVLEGTIRWDKTGDTDRIRITPQLIKVADNTHLWADNYEFALTQIFAVQAEIANRISESLDLTLNEAESRAIASAPTTNVKAYEFYIRGLEYFDRSEFILGEELFEKAISADSLFALGWASLSMTNSRRSWPPYRGNPGAGYDPSPARFDRAKETVDRALKLNPALAEAHLALGYYYYHIGRHYDQALPEFEKALLLKPNSAEVISAIGFINRRLGNWPGAYAKLKQASQLDPLSKTISSNFMATCLFMRLFDEALEVTKRGVSLHPDESDSYVAWANTLGVTGKIKEALTVLEEAEKKVDKIKLRGTKSWLAILARDYENALNWAVESRPNAQAAVDECDYFWSIGRVYSLMRNSSKCAAYLDSALNCYQSLMPNNVTADDSAWTLMGIAICFAKLDRKEEAIRFGETAYQLIPMERDAWVSTQLLYSLFFIYSATGESDKAFDAAEELLSKPSDLTVPILELDPEYDRLRDHPRYKALLKKYGS